MVINVNSLCKCNQVTALQQESEKFEHDVMVKQKTLEMLPSAAENIGNVCLGYFDLYSLQASFRLCVATVQSG